MIKLIAEKVYHNTSIVHMKQSNNYVERFWPFICSNSLGLQLSPVFRKSLSSLSKTDFFRIYTTERKVSLQFGWSKYIGKNIQHCCRNMFHITLVHCTYIYVIVHTSLEVRQHIDKNADTLAWHMKDTRNNIMPLWWQVLSDYVIIQMQKQMMLFRTCYPMH